MKKYYKEYDVTASIMTHRDGTATLKIVCGLFKRIKTYKNEKSAYAAWRRFCA